MRTAAFCITALAAALPAAMAAQDAPWLPSSLYNQLHVVIGSEAAPAEQFAAEEFVRLWEACTGHTPACAHTHDSTKVNVYIGRTGNPHTAALELAGLGDEGYHIRTTTTKETYPVRWLDTRRPTRFPLRLRRLLIAGGAQRGTLYGVYAFFHDVLGMRWLTPDVTHIPEPPRGLPGIDTRYVPPINFRDTNYWMFTRHPEFAVKHRLNGHFMRGIPEKMGGFIGYAGPFCHTLHHFVNPDDYFEEHPEYFARVNGKRRRKAQLCLSNPDVRAIVTGQVRDILRDAPPNRRIVSVTQMDYPFWCECEDCTALAEREGSQAGPMIHFANAIAARIADEFPDAYIDTLAYTYTRTPPKHVTPRDNVIVRLCAREADFFRPLTDKGSRQNRAFRKDFKRWNKIAQNLFIWDYTQNRHAFQGPHPNFHVIQPNVAFFADNGVSGVFEQAAPSPRSDFDLLKGYMVAQVLWDPEVDDKAIYDEFLALYYQDAAPYIRAYHKLITQKVREDDYVLTIFSEMEWMDLATVQAAKEIFAQAFAAVAGDEALTQRVKHAYVPVQYAALVCPPDVAIEGNRYIMRRPESQTFDEYWAMLADYGVTHIGDSPIEAFRERLDGKTPPRYAALPFYPLENSRYLVWVVPEIAGSVVRLRDKANDIELFPNFEIPHVRQGMLQEWTVMDPDAPAKERAVAETYKLVDANDERVIVQATLANALTLERTVSLEADPTRAAVSLTITNNGDAPVVPRVKLHPAFHLPDGWRGPRLYVQRGGGWTRRGWAFGNAHDTAMAAIEPDRIDAWAVRLPGARAYLLNTVVPDQLEALVYYLDLRASQAILELVPDLRPIEPGGERTIDTAYAVVEKLP
ncbi:MAG: DUF4838 domain-containing protein [Candidatus Hydrogenedentota bacterium]